MKNLMVLTTLLGGMAVSGGCQMSENRHVETDRRPADYNMAYTATKDTDWRSSTADNASTGTVTKGTTVYFDKSADNSMTWQQARVGDGYVRWVRPADYRMQ